MKPTVFILLSAVLIGSCVKKEVTETISFPAVVENEKITRLEVEVDVADVIIAPSKDGTSTVKADLEYCGRQPDHKVEVSGSTLHLTMDCYPHSRCGGQFYVTVPPAVAADIALGAGNIEVSDLTGDLEISSGAGNIRLTRVSGEVDVRNGAGNVEGIDFASTTYSVKTGAGNITLRAKNAPTYARLKSGVGNVDLYVPSSSYDLSLSSGLGSSSAAGVVSDQSAQHVIQAHSGVGNVSVEGI